MKWIVRTALVAMSFSAAGAPPCALTPEKLTEFFAMDYAAFDQAPNAGFRELEQHCPFEAGLAIDAWLAHKGSSLEPWQIGISNFHAGQMYASARPSLYPTAVSHFERALTIAEPADAELKWNAYVGATIAFLKKDRAGLRARRAEVAASNAPTNLKNLAVVDRLIRCFDRPYAEAYTPGAPCGP